LKVRIVSTADLSRDRNCGDSAHYWPRKECCSWASGRIMQSGKALTKRTLIGGVSAAAASVILGARGAKSASREDDVLNIYLVLWPSDAPLVPWTDPSPRQVAEAGSFVIWRYIRELGDNWVNILLQRDKPSVIGHASIVAKISGKPLIVFSNTGGDVGFYSATDSKHPRAFLQKAILASCYFAETLTGHSSDGRWESHDEYVTRIRERQAPRVSRIQVRGVDAQKTYDMLNAVLSSTTGTSSGPGAPKNFGLNTTEVRLITDFGRTKKMKSYLIGGRMVEIHGGCANAVASVLDAVGLGEFVPKSAAIKMNIALSSFRGAVLPIVRGEEAFDAYGKARDPDLVGALDRLPTTWVGASTRNTAIRFTDPNYWVREMGSNSEYLAEVHRLLGIS
jgi:hypothetical protein